MPTKRDLRDEWPTLVVNGEGGAVTNAAAEEFIKKVQEARDLGFGFVPILGAGFSAPSGVPFTHELRPYLAKCVGMALGADPVNSDVWNPRTDQWPPVVDGQKERPEGWWEKQVLEALSRATADKSDQAPILAQALGSMAEWRSALQFLSRLVRDPRGTSSGVLREPARLEAPEASIIDACFRTILDGKRPSLCHRMLAVLGWALRLDLLLTTNYDNLLEIAFDEARSPIEVVEVHPADALPHWSAMSDVRALVKLHGSRYALRADFSTDSPASQDDQRRFLEYLVTRQSRGGLAGGTPGPSTNGPGSLHLQNHVLVMGFSARDKRIRGLIEHAWRSLPEEFRVFWVCYTEVDVEAVRNFTAQTFSSQKRSGKSPRSVVLRHTECGLLLLQLYQTLRRNLPPVGGVFPSIPRLSLPPLQSFKKKETPGEARASQKIVEQVGKFQRDDNVRNKLIVAAAGRNRSGLTSACTAAYRKLEQDNVCLWIDMNDISSADNLFEVLLESANVRLGLEHWIPVYTGSEARPRAEEIDRLVKSAGKRWVIFLNARETPGANVSGDGEPDTENGWLDGRDQELDSGSEDHSATVGDFRALLSELCPRNSGMSVVLLCQAGKENTGLLKHLETLQPEIVRLPTSNADVSEKEIISNVVEWAGDNTEKQHFVHALALMQRPRFLSTIWSSAVLGEAGEYNRAHLLPAWVDKLEDLRLLRRKAGGFIWMDSRCRQHLRRILHVPTERPQQLKARLDHWASIDSEARIHASLAAWYERVLDASEAPLAVFETVYHLCQSAMASLSRGEFCMKEACQSIEAAAALLKRSCYLIQTRGYSRGSCRRLEHTRFSLCRTILTLAAGHESTEEESQRLQDGVHRLRLVCTEIMRAIAREVGEDSKAYLRHRQFAILLASGSWPEDANKTCRSIQKPHYFSQALYNRLAVNQRAGYVSSHKEEWLRWWRWNGILAMSCRSYALAHRALDTALAYVVDGARKCPPSKTKIDLERLSRGGFDISNMPVAKLQALGLEVETLQILELKIRLQLLERGTKIRLGRIAPPRRPPKTHAKVGAYIAAARGLAAMIRSEDHSPDAHYTMEANLCESRVLMHASINTSVDSASDEVNVTPMGLLGEAEARLRISDPVKSRFELALVDLHRAEVSLRYAESVEVISNGVSMQFVDLCSKLQSHARTQKWTKDGWAEAGKTIRERCAGAEVEKGLRQASACVTDALRFLARAEPVLRERRRNVWWTTWFFERRLRAISYSVWASIFEVNGAPIPFLGLESAAQGTDTAADIALDDSMRMIRVDAYRLATAVNSYASSAIALQMRLMLDPRSVPLKSRQDTMTIKLGDAIERLTAVRKARLKEERTGKARPRRDPDKSVQDYIDAILEGANQTNLWLRSPDTYKRV